MIEVEFGDILDAPLYDSWDDFCDKYGINVWCINEGLAERNTTIKVDIKDAKRWGMIDENEY